MARRVFYSFHYELDSWRAAKVRNMGKLDGNQPVTDNDWESVAKGGDAAIQMCGLTTKCEVGVAWLCLLVLKRQGESG